LGIPRISKRDEFAGLRASGLFLAMHAERCQHAMDVYSETALIQRLVDLPGDSPRMIQIGANDGKTEYAKVDGKDFVFEFLLQNPRWSAVLVEPIPDLFAALKRNYAAHRNSLTFLNCAVAEEPGYRDLYICGPDGKRSSLIKDKTAGRAQSTIAVPSLDYEFLCRLVGWDRVDFVKIDAEGYDAIIVQAILACNVASLVPDAIFWEWGNQPVDRLCEEALRAKGFDVFLSGLNKRGGYMDRVGLRS
jgi:FkbM family methyltransferase